MSDTLTHTFRGDGSFPNPEDGINCQLGWEHGYEYGKSVIKIGKGYDPFPGDSNKGWFGNGFAEGVKSAYSFILFSEYPQLRRTDYDPATGTMIIEFRYGYFVKIRWEGEKRIIKWSSPMAFVYNEWTKVFNKKIRKHGRSKNGI